MSLSRRRFVGLSGALALAGGQACDRLPFVGTPELEVDEIAVPSKKEPDLIVHVLSRCSFGIAPGDRKRVLEAGSGDAERGVHQWLAEQLEPETIADPVDRYVRGRFWAVSAGAGDAFELKEHVVSEELVRAALLRAVYGRRQLQEVMVHFFYDHFNVAIDKEDCRWLTPSFERDAIRRHALGSFRELLGAVTLSPAMLWYLDGRLNKREQPGDRPNENHARELLELHTLGIDGGYTQSDVIAVSRALSGFTVRDKDRFSKGKVEFDPARHDDGAKSFLGHTLAAGGGRQDVERLLDILANHPSTARFLAHKLCTHFIADAPPESAVSAVAQAFSASRGDIQATLRALFARPEFVDPEYRGIKLKRPFHLMASLLRSSAAKTDARRDLLRFLQRMGHVPYQYPTPDGYPTAAPAWRDGLLWRWHLAAALGQNQIEGTHIDAGKLVSAAGSRQALLSHLLGRKPSAEEWQAVRAAGKQALAMALALPALQRC